MINEDFFEIVVQEMNRYVEQEMICKGFCDLIWYFIISLEMKVFFGLNIIMGINQLFCIDMYWLENLFVGK